MPSFKNVSTSGDLFVLGRTVKSGEVFEVTPDEAVGLAGQPDLWQPARETKEQA